VCRSRSTETSGERRGTIATKKKENNGDKTKKKTKKTKMGSEEKGNIQKIGM